jgi:hypothetical protein
VKGLLLAVTGVFLVGCASQQPGVSDDQIMSSPQSVNINNEDLYWWYARFQMDWPDDDEPRFSDNLIIAHEVVAPLLDRYRDDIKLWRFHRRAARDAAGHQFSFIFFATIETAQSIYDEIDHSAVLDDLLQSGDLLVVQLDDVNKPERAGIDATSDHRWPLSVQRSWPYFIMGVSLMWLDLVEQEVDSRELGSRTGISDRLDYYAVVNDRITTLWKQEGRHALFHHANGIFGYEPLEIRF